MRSFTLIAVLLWAADAPQAPISASELCSLLTKAELQKITGHADAMRAPNQPDQMPGGRPVCTIDGGGGLDIELILYPRTTTKPLETPKGAETVSGVGAGAYVQTAPGNVALFAIKSLTSPHALHVGLQSDASPQAMRPIAIAIAQAALAKMK